MGQPTVTLLFQSIPPERVGLQGEYDHRGLAKRVNLALQEAFDCGEISHLRVSQRGAVVVLLGEIPNQRILIKLVNTALSIHGAVDVEINGVSVGDRLKSYLEIKPSREGLLKLLSLINQENSRYQENSFVS